MGHKRGEVLTQLLMLTVIPQITSQIGALPCEAGVSLHPLMVSAIPPLPCKAGVSRRLPLRVVTPRISRRCVSPSAVARRAGTSRAGSQQVALRVRPRPPAPPRSRDCPSSGPSGVRLSVLPLHE